jgi:hypothetical protein
VADSGGSRVAAGGRLIIERRTHVRLSAFGQNAVEVCCRVLKRREIPSYELRVERDVTTRLLCAARTGWNRNHRA